MFHALDKLGVFKMVQKYIVSAFLASVSMPALSASAAPKAHEGSVSFFSGLWHSCVEKGVEGREQACSEVIRAGSLRSDYAKRVSREGRVKASAALLQTEFALKQPGSQNFWKDFSFMRGYFWGVLPLAAAALAFATSPDAKIGSQLGNAVILGGATLLSCEGYCWHQNRAFQEYGWKRLLQAQQAKEARTNVDIQSTFGLSEHVARAL